MRRVLIPAILLTLSSGCSAAPSVCPRYPEPSQAAKDALYARCTAADEAGQRFWVPACEPLAAWLADVVKLKHQLDACR